MTDLRSDLPALPQRMRGLPVDSRGYPVPWFVGRVNGDWDFRVVRPGGIEYCLRRSTCWLCGQRLGVHKFFVLGPMCVVNQVNSEPPSHHECASFAVRACPFLTRPMAKRNLHELPAAKEIPGAHLDRNPGVVALYETKDYRPIIVSNGMLIELGDPDKIEWFAKGAPASREDAVSSLYSGVAILMKMAEEEGPTAVKMLKLRVNKTLELLPP